MRMHQIVERMERQMTIRKITCDICGGEIMEPGFGMVHSFSREKGTTWTFDICNTCAEELQIAIKEYMTNKEDN